MPQSAAREANALPIPEFLVDSESLRLPVIWFLPGDDMASRVAVPAEMAVALGMAFHELTTNSVKYGSLFWAAVLRSLG